MELIPTYLLSPDTPPLMIHLPVSTHRHSRMGLTLRSRWPIMLGHDVYQYAGIGCVMEHDVSMKC